MKKDKVKVLEEVLSEDRIKEFLTLQAPIGENKDFHQLLKAYRGMPPQYFEIFLKLFSENGGDINAKSAEGKSILNLTQEHSQSQAYVDLLRAAGAK